MTRRLILVAGARPNFMKVAPLFRALAAAGNGFAPVLVHTGQHYDDGMSAAFLEELGIPPPDACLNVGAGTHGVQTSRILQAFEEYLLVSRPKPVGVIVVGDVNSTMAAALAAVKVGIPVAHVEAGLRSFDRSMPEEINRVVTDAVADLLLVSEPSGEVNLRRQGVAPERIRFVGNVMIDTLVHELPAARALDMPARLGIEAGQFGIVTLHRPSNVDDPKALRAIVDLLEQVSRELPLVFPMHPRTRSRIEEFGLLDRLSRAPRLQPLEPLRYRHMLGLMADARFVMTDSGGIQEETTYLRIPCLTLRSNTERPATVTLGTNTLVGNDAALAGQVVRQIVAGACKRGTDIAGWDGQAAIRVAHALAEAWG